MEAKVEGGQPTPARELAPGMLVAGKYRIERLIGKGGMGAVFAASHEVLGQHVAIKVLLKGAESAESSARFLNEARAAARIRGDHVARVFDVGTLDDGSPYMVLELLEGTDLAQALVARGPLPVADVVRWIQQACEAVASAHALGIIHRDLKPSNLFLCSTADGRARVKVLDFGISKSDNPLLAPTTTLTATGTLIGSPMYMAPEQVRNAKDVDSRADVWALGVILHELLTGTPPFSGETLGALFLAIVENPVPKASHLRPEVPPGLDAVIARCLRRSPKDRFAGATDLARALASFGGELGPGSSTLTPDGMGNRTLEALGLQVITPPRSLPEGEQPPARTASSWSGASVPGLAPARRRWRLLAVGAAIVAGLAALAFALGHARTPEPANAAAAGASPERFTAAAPIASSVAPALAPAPVPTPTPSATTAPVTVLAPAAEPAAQRLAPVHEPPAAARPVPASHGAVTSPKPAARPVATSPADDEPPDQSRR